MALVTQAVTAFKVHAQVPKSSIPQPSSSRVPQANEPGSLAEGLPMLPHQIRSKAPSMRWAQDRQSQLLFTLGSKYGEGRKSRS
eukprot:1160118-Pelagomonas_calceolata.AAC.17